MALELYVWGSPSPGEVSSIDAECLAAIRYLHESLSPSRTQWAVVSSNDPSATPSNHLPSLNHNGTWISGYSHIVTYLASHSIGQPLDAALTTLQRADSTALSSFISSHLQPLLDLSLYVSAANWSAYTRPALTKLLPFPLTWTAPPLLRNQAARRVEHLGMAELDRDFDPNGLLHLTPDRDALPETFRKHIPAAMSRKTVHDEMTPEQQVAIRLHGLMEDSLGLLEKMMSQGGENGLVASQSITSVDCLAYGHLALMHDLPLPRCFLGQYMDDHTPRLASFLQRMKRIGEEAEPLPWKQIAPRSLTTLTGQIMDTVVRHVPTVGGYYADEMRIRAEKGVHGIDTRTAILLLGFITASASAGYSYLMYKSLQPFGLRHQVWTAPRGGSKLESQFGDLGSMLSSVIAPSQSAQRGQPTSRIVEMDSEVD